ncbi:MAG: GNAT family N-acetyltransferase [Gammaproteobacteria bacterium]|nr:GNAT family N-acetyltransferase [Gammaproteobacteria bacterium]MCY4227989.1 GNAT family N-acetyltransferase [Gammaproteobacteria bacterium]
MNAEIRRSELSDPQILRLISQLDSYQSELYPPESNHLDSPHDLKQAEAFLVGAFIGDHAVGIGAVKLSPSMRYGEIKRVYVEENSRGLGISGQIMGALEAYARDQGCHSLVLETGIFQKSAIRLYERLGYHYRTAFGDYPADDPHSVFMEKNLAESSRELLEA